MKLYRIYTPYITEVCCQQKIEMLIRIYENYDSDLDDFYNGKDKRSVMYHFDNPSLID